ncbi:hypothetical protein HMPREF9944_00502 [Segatella maculosa OT 289]|uniref:Uncharacterized protein n=1 Tax=Segatella maculosa OT 289 TaxID=999422 RepID=H1HK08_9BACT|nr:hypothetical protein HMPREF9944_00502 [Segatella maculosa OT 289]
MLHRFASLEAAIDKERGLYSVVITLKVKDS